MASTAKVKVALEPYGNRKHSGVKAFAALPGGLLVQYHDGEAYLYDETRPGTVHLAKMLDLAHEGSGLSAYISQHVRENYAGKFTAEEVRRLQDAAD